MGMMDIDTSTREALGLLEQLIATPSVSREESAAADIVYNYLKDKGLEPRRTGNNVWARGVGFDESKPTILLNAHVDTVRPTKGWTRDPFAATWEDGRLYGLGSNDCGGGLVALMQVALHVRPRRFNLLYLASAEEEVSGRGGMESVVPLLPRVDFAIVGEPTGMQPATAEKGLMVVDATARGRSGHAARDEGLNAIYVALDDVQRLRQDDMFPKVSHLLGRTKTTVTIIGAGTQHNVVPDECRFTIDVRTNELYTNEEVLAILRRHLTSELVPRSTRLASSHIDDGHPFVRRCRALGLQPYGSPTLSDQALMPWPSLKLGPGDSARSHTPDEYIVGEEIGQAIRLYQALLEDF